MRKALLFLGLLLPSIAYGQGGSVNGGGIVVLSATGRPIGGATVTICAFGATGIPCSPTITVYTSPTLSVTASNPDVTDGNGNLFKYAAPGRYTYTVTGPGIIGTSYTATVAGSGGGDVLSSGNNVLTGNNTLTSINGIILVDGTTYPFTNAGIQSAVNAAPDGGTVMLGPGTFVLTGTGSEEVLITKKLNFICSGWATILQVGASVPGTTDIIHLKPSALVQGAVIKDCYIAPASGTPGRHGISIDGTTTAISNLQIIHNRIDALGGKSIAVINATGQATGTPFTTTIADNVTQGGIDLTNAGDSLNIENNTMTGSGGIIVFPVGATVQPASNGGAHGIYFKGNNVTNTGGIIINNGWQGAIAYNDIEVANLAESNASCIDISGNSNANMERFQIVGNFIACSNGASAVNAIRVDRANTTLISGNLVVRSVGGSLGYSVTANAIGTQIFQNRQIPTTEAISVWLSDSGTNTTVDYTNQTTNARVLSNTGFGANGSGAPNHFFNGVQGRAGSTSVWGFSSGTDPSATGLDTGLSRLGAASVGVGNGVAGDVSGSLRTCSYLITSLLLSCSVPTIASGFNTSGFSITTNGTASFSIVVGTGAGTSVGAITLPTATTGWNCWLTNQTRADQIQQSASSATSATFTNYGTTFAATNFTNSDVLRGGCVAY